MKIAIAIASILLSGTVHANLIQNGNFEDTFVGFNGSSHIFGADTMLGGETFAGWSVSGHSVDLVDREWVVAAQGRNSVDLVGFASGTIYQDIVAVPGTYHLRFAMTAGTGLFRPMLAILNVSAGAYSENFTFLSIRQVYPGQEWDYHEVDFTVNGNFRISFTDVTQSQKNFLSGAVIDDISLEGPIGPVVMVPDNGDMITLLACGGAYLLRK